jgi:hypothetical protein
MTCEWFLKLLIVLIEITDVALSKCNCLRGSLVLISVGGEWNKELSHRREAGRPRRRRNPAIHKTTDEISEL